MTNDFQETARSSGETLRNYGFSPPFSRPDPAARPSLSPETHSHSYTLLLK
ncbi:hypothetical protein Y88_0505 [Novosphingobium nitrogenifigens DSM 19370]|uniref:Uncharacterized protein n=1 Tax=Novosphingobium nitrogenifigens DSM 19370 TaxID=983920 RepID=F1ZAE3_9SPHN|nr:hypothetical protein Y88_0505 [Novosphingobium nitrogenifigens DSM 19370]